MAKPKQGIPVSKEIDEIIQYSNKCLTDKYNKSSIDLTAAGIILQEYLDSK